MLVSCAGTGVLLGYLSLLDVHRVIEQGFGSAAGWAVAAGSLLLSSFGVYLGRFLRWNSWNALTDPVQLIRSIVGVFIDSGKHPHPVPVTLVFGTSLIVGYSVLRVFATHSHEGCQTQDFSLPA